jgi:hypothetical protein
MVVCTMYLVIHVFHYSYATWFFCVKVFVLVKVWITKKWILEKINLLLNMVRNLAPFLINYFILQCQIGLRCNILLRITFDYCQYDTNQFEFLSWVFCLVHVHVQKWNQWFFEIFHSFSTSHFGLQDAILTLKNFV